MLARVNLNIQSPERVYISIKNKTVKDPHIWTAFFSSWDLHSNPDSSQHFLKMANAEFLSVKELVPTSGCFHEMSLSVTHPSFLVSEKPPAKPASKRRLQHDAFRHCRYYGILSSTHSFKPQFQAESFFNGPVWPFSPAVGRVAIGDEIIAKVVAVKLWKSFESFTREYDPLHGTFVLANHFHDVCDLGNIAVGMVENYNGLVAAWDFNGLRGAVGNQSKGRRSVSRRRIPVEDGCADVCWALSRSLLGFADGRVRRGGFSHALSVQWCKSGVWLTGSTGCCWYRCWRVWIMRQDRDVCIDWLRSLVCTWWKHGAEEQLTCFKMF